MARDDVLDIKPARSHIKTEYHTHPPSFSAISIPSRSILLQGQPFNLFKMLSASFLSLATVATAVRILSPRDIRPLNVTSSINPSVFATTSSFNTTINLGTTQISVGNTDPLNLGFFAGQAILSLCTASSCDTGTTITFGNGANVQFVQSANSGGFGTLSL